jgi:hypothetical protein
MAGGIMQIISYGTQDLTLTGNPEITFFNIIYRRYTNFGKKLISLSFDNSPEFNSISYVNIPKNSGDLLTKLILRIKLPKIDFSFINEKVNEQINNNLSFDNKLNLSYYNYFLNFFNKLKNIIRNFFLKYDAYNISLTYIQDLENYILKYFNIYQFSQFFLSINYFFNNDISLYNLNKYNTIFYTNASLFKIVNNNLVYIYEKFTNEMISYNGFKFTINKNMEILEELNTILYNKLYTQTLTDNNIKFCWVNKIAIFLFNSIDLYVGSNKIYSLSDTYINNYGELYYKNKELYNKLIGNGEFINIYSDSIDETTLYLPIPFWNLSNYGLSFPLIALQFNSLQIRINTKKFLDCIRIFYDKNLFSDNINNIIIDLLLNNLKNVITGKIDITLLLEYAYLDRIERRKFARSAHEYLIEQVQEIEFNKITSTNNTIQLDIFHCCKDMFWFAQRIPKQSDIFNNNPNVLTYIYERNKIQRTTEMQNFYEYVIMVNSPFILFNPNIYFDGLFAISNNLKAATQFSYIIDYLSNKYNYPLENDRLNIIIKESYFSLNSVQLIGENYSFFNFLQPYNYYNANPQLGLNIYSFSLRPTEFQPAGSCNMSRISFIALKLKITDKQSLTKLESLIQYENTNTDLSVEKDEYRLIFQTRNYNVMRLIGGIGATAYTYQN